MAARKSEKPRNQFFIVRLDVGERAALQERARAEGRTMAEVARDLLAPALCDRGQAAEAGQRDPTRGAT